MSETTTLYRFYDAEWRLLYVGISWNPHERFGQHRNGKPWWEYVAFIRVDHYATRETAQAAEQDTIREERPPFNTVSQNRYVREILTASRTVVHPPVTPDGPPEKPKPLRAAKAERRAIVMRLIRSNPRATWRDVQARLGVSDDTAQKELADARKVRQAREAARAAKKGQAEAVEPNRPAGPGQPPKE